VNKAMRQFEGSGAIRVNESTRKARIAIRAARDEALRRARNGKFYADTPHDISERAREMWRETVRDAVTEARELNRALVRIRKLST
jgi:hypothetical protein